MIPDYSKEREIVDMADNAKWRVLHRYCTYDCKLKRACEACPIGKQLEELHTEMSNG